MQTNDIKKNKSNQTSIKVGRGGKRGKTSGKGHKGQNARTGNSNRTQMRDIIKKFPKLRGSGKNGNKNSAIMKSYFAVNLNQLDVFSDKDMVTPTTLLEKGLVKKVRGRIPDIKILGTGEISVKVDIRDCKFSKTAAEKIEKAGGSIK